MPVELEIYHFEDDPQHVGYRITLETFLARQLGLRADQISSSDDADDLVDEIKLNYKGKAFVVRYILYSELEQYSDDALLAAKLHIVDLLINGRKHKGFDLCARLDSLGYPRERTIFLTGFREEVDAHFKDGRKYQVLQKPATATEILELIWAALKSDFLE